MACVSYTFPTNEAGGCTHKHIYLPGKVVSCGVGDAQPCGFTGHVNLTCFNSFQGDIVNLQMAREVKRPLVYLPPVSHSQTGWETVSSPVKLEKGQLGHGGIHDNVSALALLTTLTHMLFPSLSPRLGLQSQSGP